MSRAFGMADDAGALMVRSGLVPNTALDDARIRVANVGGTIGEQLVAAGVIGDDALTDFYRSRLLVPQVNPNTLARLPKKVVSTIPSDMAIELRAIPVSLDNDNNLTVAMSDPSDSHAVDEIAFFTGTYVVRAVATQMQIAWCLAHYYGHITALGQRLLQPTGGDPPPPPPSSPEPRSSNPAIPRAKGLTAKVEATRHRAIAPLSTPVDLPRPRSGQLDAVEPPAEEPQPALRAASAPELAEDGTPDRPRARSVSGEIRVPTRQRAASIRPPMPEPHLAEGEDDEGPVITMEAGDPDEDATGPRKVPLPRKKQKPNPPELAERGGEIDAKSKPFTTVVLEEARIIVQDEPPIEAHVSGELRGVKHREVAAAPAQTIEVSDDTSVGVVIHESYARESEPVLLDRKRPSDPPTNRIHAPRGEPESDEDDVVVELQARKPKPSPQPRRPEKRTQVGIGALPALTRTHRDTEAGGVPTIEGDDPTRVDAYAVSPAPDDITDETIAPPAPGASREQMRTPSVPLRALSSPRAPSNDDDADIDGPVTSVMTAVELDVAIPERDSDMIPAHLAGQTERNRRIDYDPVDDGWGPPGTTIPPPLLGAVPGSDDDDGPGRIPVANVDDAPLILVPPTAPQGDPGKGLVRELEEATSRSIELIHSLERAGSRDDVVQLMIDHLAGTHRRAGFFSIKSGELGVFAMHPKPELIPVTSLRLDRPSTLQDVVGTRLPYRGPTLDDASKNFLAAILGSAPPEILLVPVAIRERVVGVLYGEHRHKHTFDDQLALAARAAGMALERILKAKPR